MKNKWLFLLAAAGAAGLGALWAYMNAAQSGNAKSDCDKPAPEEPNTNPTQEPVTTTHETTETVHNQEETVTEEHQRIPPEDVNSNLRYPNLENERWYQELHTKLKAIEKLVTIDVKTFYAKRAICIQDLLDDDKIIGMTRSQVEYLLGIHERVPNPPNYEGEYNMYILSELYTNFSSSVHIVAIFFNNDIVSEYKKEYISY